MNTPFEVDSVYMMVKNCRLHAIDPIAHLTAVMPPLWERMQV